MKRRTIAYLNRQKAIRDMIQFKDIQSFLMAGLKISKSLVVKRDILETLSALNPKRRPAYARA